MKSAYTLLVATLLASSLPSWSFGQDAQAQVSLAECKNLRGLPEDIDLVHRLLECVELLALRDSNPISQKAVGNTASTPAASASAEPFALTMRGPKFNVTMNEANTYTTIKFTDTVNQTASARASFDSGIITIPRDGLYAISLFGRVDHVPFASDNYKAAGNVYFRMNAVENSVFFYSGAFGLRQGVAGTIFLYLSEGVTLSFSVLYPIGKDKSLKKTVTVDNVYFSIALVN